MNVLTITREAGEDLSTKQYFFATATADGKCALSGADDRVLGVITNDPESGEAAAIQVAGVVRITAGAAFAVGDLLKADAAGKAIEAALGAGTKEEIAGMALEAATADGDIVEMLVRPQTLTTET